MTRKWLVVSTILVLLVLLWFWRKENRSKPANGNLHGTRLAVKESVWVAPDSNTIPQNNSGELIRYGKKLIRATGRYFGPQGSINQNANGMNCQNCHLDA